LNAKTDKSLEDAMIRELREETGLKIPEKVIRGSIKAVHTFDAVNRSERGRTITQAFHVSLTDGEWNLPKVKGMDDAEKAKWVPFSQVKSEEMFEDHYDLFRYFVPGA
jgi:bifunctional NMN adenylyltransferase/nudix hydrolase